MSKTFAVTGLFAIGIVLAASAPAAAEWRYRESGHTDCSAFKSETRSLTSPSSRDSEAQRRCCESLLGQPIRPGVDALCPISTYMDN